MKLLVTGADGYIGSVMAPYLAGRGHLVTGLDVGFYRSGWLFNDFETRPSVITRDVRQVEAKDLEGYDAVIHLAELSNDPLGEHTRENTFDINHRGSLSLARAAKLAGVSRFVYASSCSVYGVGSGETMTEGHTPNPQTAYAECKVLCERELLDITDRNFTVTMLRNATAFGASPRMRFDIVLNNLAGLAWTLGKIVMTSDGTPWRPLVHILDICQAFALVLEAPASSVCAQILNVGADEQNFTVREIAEVVARVFPGCVASFGQPGGDNRSYRVSFRKIRDVLPSFSCEWSAERGAQQLRTVFESIAMTAQDFEGSPYTRLKELKRLVETGQIDSRFFWVRAGETEDQKRSEEVC